MATTWTEMQKLQPRVMKLLQNSIERNRLAHAYLFEGRKGTGKLDAATLLAKAFCLEDGAEPCESCRNCQRIESGNHPDVHVVHPDGLSIKRDKSRRFRKSFLRPVWNRIKAVYYFPCGSNDGQCGEQPSKVLEEPSSDTIAVLLTEQPQNCSIRSYRDARFYPFSRCSPNRLKRNWSNKRSHRILQPFCRI